MKLSKLRAALMFGMSAVLLVGLGGVGHASAQASNGNGGNTLKISPVRTELIVKPGESKKVTTFITNLSKATAVLKPIQNDFVAGDESGTPSIILDENSYAPAHSLKRFMAPLGNVTVEAGATKQVDVTLNVPKEAKAGGYFGALRFAPASATSGANVNLTGSVTSLILMTVPGDLQEAMNVTDFNIQQKGSVGSNFRTSDNLEVAMRFENVGNVHAAPFGKISVLKDDKVVHEADFNVENPKANVLPDGARKWTVPIKDMGKFGKYKIVGNFTYGTSNKSIEVNRTIWIVPTLYIIIGIALLVGLIALIVFIRIWLKAYKKRILQQAGKR